MAALLERDDRLRVYVAGGFTGGVMGKPVDITVDNLPDDIFERAQQIIKLLTAAEEELNPEEIEERNQTTGGLVGDFGHFVEAGNHNDEASELSTLFNGSWLPTPLIVSELETTLKAHATPQDLVLKP